MLTLLRAAFQNFRLLRDLEIEFSGCPDRNLTIIRAANESGKTTIMHGLQWALYGDSALPGKGDNFRLHPIDWPTAAAEPVPITATVDFVSTTGRRIRGEWRETRDHYRLVRSAFEDIDSNARRSPSTVNIFKVTPTGAERISAPEAVIEEMLPPELREVFFTDGDRALSFIEATATLKMKRERVERAIRSLLGLGVVGDAIKHVENSSREANRKAKQVGSDAELNAAVTRLDALENNREKLERDLADAREQFRAFDEKVKKLGRQIEEALQKGDKEALGQKLELTKRDIKRLDDQILVAAKDHSAQFRGRSIATDLIASNLTQAFETLEELRQQGKIPNTTIPVLQDRLASEVCICGETLDNRHPAAERRRAHIERLIADSTRADEDQKIITDLYYGAKPLRPASVEDSAWRDDYKKIIKQRADLQSLREVAGRNLRALEQQLKSLPDADIRGLRDAHCQYMKQRDRYLRNQSTIETQLTELQKERRELEARRTRLLREQEKGQRIQAELEVTQDVINVLESAYERITSAELQKVSALMNSLFLEIIGADPEQDAIIQRAEISQDFDIIVYGSNNRTLNPDRDLNGASRRAISLAFILALTKVSEVDAPNVIDTPLGMTAGFVKRSMLRTAVRESVQLVLFLTHDEIAGCEDIIDASAGVVTTLTNPAHYPKILVNDPGVKERKVLRCPCDHNTYCKLCQRCQDERIELETTP